MSRSAHGCYTCRLRHKKCDEGEPRCQVCASRGLRCLGYEKPEWLNGGPEEQRFRVEIKQSIKRNVRLNRRALAETVSTDHGDRSRAGEQKREVRDGGVRQTLGGADFEREAHDGCQEKHLDGEEFEREARHESEGTACDDDHAQSCARFPTNSIMSSIHAADTTFASSLPSMAADTDPWHGAGSGSGSGQSVIKAFGCRETELLMHYFDVVFPLQFRFHAPHSRSAERGWLLWLLLRTGPLYHAALSLSALHQFTRQPRHLEGGDLELNDYHSRALQDLRMFLHAHQHEGALHQRSRHLEVLACGVSLISFELFRGGLSDWQLHLNALAAVVASTTATTPPVSSLGDHSVAGPQEESSRMERTAWSFLTAVVLWFDLVACVSTGTAPRLPYTSLIHDHGVNLEDVMGCQNWTMIAIGDIAVLNSWTALARERGTLVKTDLATKSQAIEATLRRGLAALDAHRSPTTPLGAGSELSALRVRQATRVFAWAALVQLRTIVHGAFPHHPSVRDAVEGTVTALRAVQDVQDCRGLVWPLCLAGCLADVDHQLYFTHLVQTIVGGARSDFGNSVTVLRIMTQCWDARRRDSTQEWDWARAMSALQVCALLV